MEILLACTIAGFLITIIVIMFFKTVDAVFNFERRPKKNKEISHMPIIYKAVR